MAKNKKFRLVDAILSVITVVFVAEAAAPAAAIGNSQFFWWIFLIIAFLLPYGLVVSELGTTYDDEGGLYDWVRRAFGDKWGSRVSWYYWINFPLWMASLAFLFPETISMITGMEIGLVPSLAIELAFVWIVVFLSFSKVSDSAWILNLAAVLKVGIALVVGGLGIWYAVNFGFANDMAPETFLPALDSNSLTYLSIILFNFMGFEVITTYVGSMENPNKQIPRAIIAGGIAIAALYLFSSFGIGAAIPAMDISLDSGIMDAVGIMAGVGSVLFIVVGIVFLITLFGNMVSWSFGVNFVAEHAARKKNMPKVFAHESEKNQMPTGAAIVNGVVASVLVLLSPVMELAGFHEHCVPADQLHSHVPRVFEAAQNRPCGEPRVQGAGRPRRGAGSGVGAGDPARAGHHRHYRSAERLARGDEQDPHAHRRDRVRHPGRARAHLVGARAQGRLRRHGLERRPVRVRCGARLRGNA